MRCKSQERYRNGPTGLIFAEPLGFQRATPYGYKVLGVTNLNMEAPSELFTNIRERQLAKD